MGTIAEQVNLLREVKKQYGNNIDCQKLIDRLIGSRHKCPQCDGLGYTTQRYNAYPSCLSDSEYGELWKYRNKTCDLCNGEGYTDCEYKPRMVQDGWVKA